MPLESMVQESMLEAKAFGRLKLKYYGNCLVPPATRKSCSLLVYLLVNRETAHNRGQLASMFWGNRPESKARRSLTTALWHIRRALPDKELIWSDTTAIRIAPNSQLFLDSEQFSKLARSTAISDQQAAVDLYLGDFLEGYYDDWVISERYRLEAILMNTMVQLMENYEQGGYQEAALNIASHLLERDPLREEAHRLAMRVYCHLGQRNQAIAQYHHCCRIVLEELNVAPMAETKALYNAIVSGQWSIGAEQPDSVHPVRPPVLSAYGPFDFEARVPFVGREVEQKVLDDLWRDASGKAGGLLLIGGESGLGKTHLIKNFADSLRWFGLPVVEGRCFQYERILPYQPLTEAIRDLIAELSAQDLNSFPDWILKVIARLVPELIERRPEFAGFAFGESDQDQAYLFNATSQFLIRLASFRPVLLILEDLHWASKSTLEFVHFLGRQAVREKILIVGSYRPEALHADHPLRPLIQNLERDHPERLVHLSPLSPGEVAKMVGDMAGGTSGIKSLAKKLYHESEGNPFYIKEMVKALFEKGWLSINEGQWQVDFQTISEKSFPLPVKLRSVIQDRVSDLDGHSSEGLYRATVLGREFDFDVLQAMWDQGTEETLEAVDTLLRRRLIAEEEGPTARDYIFTHHKIQEVLYEKMPRRRRQHFHARAAAVFEKQEQALAGGSAAEIAYHFEKGQIFDKALFWYEQAGDQARERFALAEASNYYSQSLALIEEDESSQEAKAGLLLKRAKVLLLLAELSLAEEDLVKALTIFTLFPCPEKIIDLLLTDAECLIKMGRYAEAAAVAERAHSMAVEESDIRLTGIARRWQGEAIRWLGRGREARQFLEDACYLLGETKDDQALAWAHFSLACNSICLLGEIDTGIPHLEQAERLFEKGSNRLGELQTIHHWGRLKFLRRDIVGSIDEYERALELAADHGLQVQESLLNGEMLISHIFLGDLDSAEKYAEICLLNARQSGERHWQGHAQFWSGVISFELGDFVESRKRLEDSLQTALELGHQPGVYLANKQLALLHRTRAEKDDLEKVRRYAEQALAAIRLTGQMWHELQAKADLAIAYASLKDCDKALAYAEEAAVLHDQPSDVFFFDEYLFNLAQVYRGCGDMEKAGQYLLAAHQELQTRAEKILDLKRRQTFMENLWVNRAILSAVDNWPAG